MHVHRRSSQLSVTLSYELYKLINCQYCGHNNLSFVCCGQFQTGGISLVLYIDVRAEIFIYNMLTPANPHNKTNPSTAKLHTCVCLSVYWTC